MGGRLDDARMVGRRRDPPDPVPDRPSWPG
jgi:hypothetical protein